MNPSSLHLYDNLSLSGAGYCLGAFLVLIHLVALVFAGPCQEFLKKAPRNEVLGQITLGVALIFFFLLIAPAGDGWLSVIRVDLPGFEGLRPFLQLMTPVVFFLMIFYVKEFLFARALGILGLLIVAPLLGAAFLKEPSTRLLISFWCYGVILMSLFWIGKPYLMRDQIAWVIKTPLRWKLLAGGGLFYGLLILVCDFLYWS